MKTTQSSFQAPPSLMGRVWQSVHIKRLHSLHILSLYHSSLPAHGIHGWKEVGGHYLRRSQHWYVHCTLSYWLAPFHSTGLGMKLPRSTLHPDISSPLRPWILPSLPASSHFPCNETGPLSPPSRDLPACGHWGGKPATQVPHHNGTTLECGQGCATARENTSC